MQDRQTLVIYTKAYPYGLGEAFLHNEVLFLSGKFKKIILVPLEQKDRSVSRKIPANVEVFNAQASPVSKVALSITVLFLAIAEKKRWTHIKNLRYVLSYFSNIMRYEKSIAELCQLHPQAIHYTYWFEDWALLLGILRKKKKIGRFISRAHGYDLFEKRWSRKFIPFRSFELKKVNRLVFASADAHDQILAEHPSFGTKFSVSTLGTYDHGPGPIPSGNMFTLVSCSNVIALKRVGRITEVLKEIGFPVRWFHFGDGPLLDAVKQQAAALPPGIQVVFKGNVENSALIEFYKHEPIDAMVLLSETEGGVPVSLQEAASFGIPLVGTRAGGIPEIVNDHTGFLVSPQAGVQEIKLCLEKLRSNGLGRQEAFRQSVRQYWQQHYNAHYNFERFYQLLVD